MKLEEYLKNLNIAYESPTVYKKGGWGLWKDNVFQFDCICLIKSVLWGFVGLHEGHGGAVYKSNGVPDWGETRFFNQCYEISTDFTHIQEGELVWMTGHIGTYVGNGYVIEATSNSLFGVKKVIKSQIGPNGERIYNGKKSGKNWLKHGFSPYIDYGNTYTVKGDTLESIAKEFNVTVEALIEVNDIKDNKLYVGQELIIPKSKQYEIINAKGGVWSRLNGYGLDKPKYKLIPYQTKVELLQKNCGTADGYNWDKIIYEGQECYLPNKWSIYE